MHESAQLFYNVSQHQFHSGNWFGRSVSKPEVYADAIHSNIGYNWKKIHATSNFM